MHPAQEPQAALSVSWAGAAGALFGTRLAQAGIPVHWWMSTRSCVQAIRERRCAAGPTRARCADVQAQQATS